MRWTWTYAPATCTDSSAPTALGRRRQCGCCWDWYCRPPARQRSWGCRCRPLVEPCCRALARWWRARRPTPIYPPPQTSLCSTPRDPTAVAVRRVGPRSWTPWSRLDSTRPIADRSARIPKACVSGGLAAALMRRAPLLILDEPTNGLDPHGAQEIRRLLLELNAQGTSIFLSSHLLAEIEQMCTRVGVLRRGRLILQEKLDSLLQPTGLVAVRTRDIDQCITLLEAVVASTEGDRLLVRAEDPARLNAYLVGEGVRVDEIGPYRRTLEDVVLEAEARA